MAGSRDLTAGHRYAPFMVAGLRIATMEPVPLWDSINEGEILNVSFNDFRFGYASCIAYTVSVAVLIISLILNRLRLRSQT